MQVVMTKRQFLLCLSLSILFAGQASAQTAIPKVGLIASAELRPIQRFKSKLSALGYRIGQNLEIIEKYARGDDRLYPQLAAEAIGAGAEILATWGTPAAFAAKNATSKIPIVLGAVGDVLHIGLIANLSHPEANITGFSAVNVELEAKRFETLLIFRPSIKKI